MNRRTALFLAATTSLCLGIALPVSTTVAQQKSIKEQLTGTWMLVSWEQKTKDGAAVVPLGGPPKGTLMFAPNGRFSFVTTTDLPKVASNNRIDTTPAEDKAIVRGSLAYFGSYSVNEPEKTLILHIEGSSYPNLSGTDGKRLVTAISADEFKYTNPATTDGGTTNFVWRRAQ